MRWTYEYDETGGYDCMTPAALIKQDGRLMFAIDAKDHGYNSTGNGSSVAQIRAESIVAIITIARSICGALEERTL